MGTNFYKKENCIGPRHAISKILSGNLILFFFTFLFWLSLSEVSAQTSPLSFTQIPFSSTDFTYTPFRGAEQWNNSSVTVDVPTQGTGVNATDAYYRFQWYQIETGNRVYDWSLFDQQINSAIDNGQKFSFGVMPNCPYCGGPKVGGALLGYPAFLHTLMQAEAQPDWITPQCTMWVPNWNSNSYLTAVENFCIDVNTHLNNTSHNGILYKDVINAIDIRSYGAWGEWHGAFIINSPSDYPAGTQPTSATLKRIIDAYKNGLPNFQLQLMISAFDGNYLGNTMNPADVGVYGLQSRNAHGLFGWRRDSWGDNTDAYLHNYLELNNRGTAALPQMKDSIMTRYKNAPVTGEPNFQGNYLDLPAEVRLYKINSFGNGNLGFTPGANASSDSIRMASKLAGHRLQIEGGALSTTLTAGNPFTVTLNWRNAGLTPIYENWNIVFELRNSSNVAVWSQNSTFDPRLFLPSATTTPITDNFIVPSSLNGTYSLVLICRDPKGYRKPLYLAITGRNADGSYLLRNNIVIGPGSGNKSPTANAGADQSIQLPVSTVSFTGTGADTDGSISSYAWTKLSGPASGTITTPATASTTITGLIQGVYLYVLTVTDNQGAIGADTVQVTVNPAVANLAPIANAGTDLAITLPVSSVTINGSASSDPDGSISTYLWTKISGPAQFTIGNTTIASTIVSNLTAGSYSFQLKVTDNGGATALDTVQVTVNPAPVNQPPISNAGADQNITLPTNSVTINGSASSDPDGTISTYLWTKVSGPAQFTIGNTGTASTLVSNLTAGVYSFQLKVTDNGGAIALDTIKVNVNPAPVNQPPVANAGADIAITLPTNIANLSGSASTDPDGTLSAYAWSQVSGPSSATISNVSNVSTGLTGLQQGVYIFTLNVTDNQGAADLDSVVVTVNPAPNAPPVANAGVSKTITLPVNSTSLDGSLSSDPDGSINFYNWSQVSGPSAAVITGSTAAIATASSLVGGLYTFQLTVTDNLGATAKATVKITVASTTPQPPIANAGADQTITLPTNNLTIDGSASSASSGSIVSYAWTETSGPTTASLSNTAVNTLNNLQAGVYVFSLTVTDNNAATGTDVVTITVNPASNVAPVADARASANLVLPVNTVSLDGTHSYDPDGSISSYSWTQISGPNTPASTGANASTLNLSGLIAGQFIYQLTVTDNSGASSSAQVKVIVSPAANVIPVANAGANQSITAPASTVILNGSSSSDPDGSITAYSWVTISGPGSITISNSNTAAPSVQGLSTGVYIFELTVTDNSGANAKDQVTVIVNPKPVLPNQAPVANAGSNQTITEPENSLALNGSSSFDPDGTISGFNWTQISGPSSSVISAGNTVAPDVSQLIVGQYVYQLTVTDNNGTTNTDQVTITVNAGTSKINLSPIANAGISDTIGLPTNSYTLDATRSTDPDGTIDSYQWQQISGPNTANSSAMNNAQVTLGNLEQGEYQFEVTVTDNGGATSTATMKLTVEQGFSLATRVSVFPNPASSVIHEKITSSIMGTVKINVYDMNGRLVLTSQDEKTSDVIYCKMNVSQLAPGMYTIQINIANRKTIVSKFIKN